NRMLAFPPERVQQGDQVQVEDYHWKLKDANWDFFDFERSRGRVVLINLWATWKLPSEAELPGIQDLYDRYGDRMDFYIITNENREPVEAFMEEHGFTFPVTYLVIGEQTPFPLGEVPSSYLLDKKGNLLIDQEGISDWNNTRVHALLDS